MLRKLLVTAALVVSMGAVVGCNTIHGAGKDVERGGEKLQEAAHQGGVSLQGAGSDQGGHVSKCQR